MLGRYNVREHMTLACTAMANLQSSWQVAASPTAWSLSASLATEPCSMVSLIRA